MNPSTDDIAGRLLATTSAHPLRVGIDGWCGAGKTTFRRGLAERLRRSGRPVLELDSDGFHNPRAIRYRRGWDSARGYYEDAYDFAALVRLVLRPLGPGGDRRVATAVLDLESDARVLEWTTVPNDGVVLFDATFLQRGGLRRLWDEVVYLDVDEATCLRRGIERDTDSLGGADAAEAAYRTRYHAACRIYEDEESPVERASVVVR